MSKRSKVTGWSISCLSALVLLTGAMPLAAQGTLFVEGDHVGIGTPTPVVPLHVVETSASPTLKNMLRLTNNGGVQFLLERTDGNNWQFSNFNASFQISIPGGPKAEFQVNSNGDVLAGNRMFATQFVTSSSRELKRDIRPVDVHDVLERLSSVPVAEWTFKGEDTRHVGPMAEDFQAAFGLGQSDTGLSLTDTNGVALAAIQALHAELQSLRKKVDDQSQLLEEQRQEIQALRAQNDRP